MLTRYGDYSLCDVPDQRMLVWLDDVVKEEHFQRMQEFGVQVDDRSL